MYIVKDGHFRGCPNANTTRASTECACKLVGYSIAILFALSLGSFEVWGGHTSGSIALLVDAVHVYSDAIVYITSAWAFAHKMGRDGDAVRAVDDRWGVRNSWILTTAACLMALYALWRIVWSEIEIPAERMLWVAALGLVGNAVMFWILKTLRIDHEHEHGGHTDHVHETSVTHTLSDAAVSLVVVLVAIAIRLYPNFPYIRFADPVASIGICVWLAYRASVIRRTIHHRQSRDHHQH